MKMIKTISMIICTVCAVSGCSGIYQADVYKTPVDPYRLVSEDGVHFGECSISFGDEVSVSGQGAWYEGNDILISEGGSYNITGCYDCGCIKVTTPDIVKLVFANAEISNPNGCAVCSNAEKLIIATDGVNSITGSGGIAETAISSDGLLVILGEGDMCINGGVFSRGGIKFGRGVSTFCEIISTREGDLIRGTLDIR